MHGQQNINICNAEQAKHLYRYKNIKTKLYKCNAAVWYNKTCRIKHVTPRYINIKVSGDNKRAQNTKKRVLSQRPQDKDICRGGEYHRLHVQFRPPDDGPMRPETCRGKRTADTVCRRKRIVYRVGNKGKKNYLGLSASLTLHRICCSKTNYAAGSLGKHKSSNPITGLDRP